MIVGLVSKAVCHVSCYLYPAYASYKALSAIPVSSPEVTRDVERWLMYWSVVGTWTAVEGLVGFAFTWIPFYSFFKLLCFLFLSLPQTEGSTYIYSTQLGPLFRQHESDIDAFLSTLRYRAGGFLSGFIGWIWEKARSQLNVNGPQEPEYAQQHGVPDPYAQGQQLPPTLAHPAAGAAQQMFSLASRYAVQYLPVAVAAMRPLQQQQQQYHAEGNPTSHDADYNEMPIPRPTGTARSRPLDPDMNLRSEISSNSEMGYEEIERSEVEQAAAAAASQRPGLSEQRSGSWFGWSQPPKSKAD